MKKRHMLSLLSSMRESETLPPIFIPSYNRPEFVSANLLRNLPDELKSNVHIVCRWEQRKSYANHNPDFTILPIPKDYPINGLASTRQFIFEYARDHRMPLIIDMDDDIRHIHYMYDGVSGKGDPCSKHSLVGDHDKDPDLVFKVLLLASCISREVFRDNPDVMLGNIRRQRMSQHIDNSQLKYIVNSGPTPRQITFVNVRGLARLGINRDMMFDRHGDDIGFCAVILANGGSLFNIPCLAYDYVSEKCDSVIRTPETEKMLHKLEYDALQKWPIKDYLKTTFRDSDGDYMWGDIDWRSYHKEMQTQPKKVFW